MESFRFISDTHVYRTTTTLIRYEIEREKGATPCESQRNETSERERCKEREMQREREIKKT